MQDTHEHGSSRQDCLRWLTDNLELTPTTSAEFLFDHTESQSGRRLAVVYLPFDATERGHFVDRGQILDFAAGAADGRVLDFGPGDGWPSLLMAPMVREVVGVDGALRRVQECAANAKRLGIGNAAFLHVRPGHPLPFVDKSFDAVVAASSIEQTPDPKATLAELHRVLRTGGRLRMHYESLGFYRGGREREVWLADMDGRHTRLIVFDRHVDDEYADNFGLAVELSKQVIKELFKRHGSDVSFDALTPEVLKDLLPHVSDAGRWQTQHPSCQTWLKWLAEAGFRDARATHDGGRLAGALFDRLSPAELPATIEDVDSYLRPFVDVVVEMEAPRTVPAGQWEHWITAWK